VRRAASLAGLLLLCLSMSLVCGCSKEDSAKKQEKIGAHTGLDEIGQMWRSFTEEKKRPPKKLADLQPYAPVYGSGVMALERDKCVVVWGADFSKTPDASKTILAYEKEAPEKGGYVLMQDGTVKEMTAQEFQAAPKCKAK
jgi:hypothetical protein